MDFASSALNTRLHFVFKTLPNTENSGIAKKWQGESVWDNRLFSSTISLLWVKIHTKLLNKPFVYLYSKHIEHDTVRNRKDGIGSRFR